MPLGRDSEWVAEVAFITLDNGEAYPFEVTIRPSAFYGTKTSDLPPGGITSRLLRAVPLGGVIKEYRAQRLRYAIPALRRTSGPPPPPRRRGRKGYDESYWAAVAILYLKACTEDPRRPIEWLAREVGGSSKATIRDQVARSRDLGFLSETLRGRPGGVPGPKLEGHFTDWREALKTFRQGGEQPDKGGREE